MLSNDLRDLLSYARFHLTSGFCDELADCYEKARAMEGHHPQPDLPDGVADLAAARARREDKRDGSLPPTGGDAA
ncbi:MAG: hypothetical protein K9H25_23125 [Rhodospirillum sp.]|nr:hypothetical protein [Rhodospirillum sp.]MCF8491387.1 hypothetical protein [Rhodospirillum sp.]MCF8503153.1 hypothetical protein [Rhodospirillum sp.]